MKNQITILSDLGLALIQASENEGVYKAGAIIDAEVKSHIKALHKRAVAYYANKPTKLKKYMRSKASDEKEYSLNPDALTIIALLIAQFYYRIETSADMRWLARTACLASDKEEDIGFYHYVIRELLLSNILILITDIPESPSVKLSRNIMKDIFGFEIIRSRSDIIKEQRIRHNKRRRDKRNKREDK